MQFMCAMCTINDIGLESEFEVLDPVIKPTSRKINIF